MTHGDGGKGDAQRPTNHEAFSKHFEEIFGKKEKTSGWSPKIETLYDANGRLIIQTIQRTPNGPKEQV